MNISKIVSGGQTGVDRAGLDVALSLAYPIGGWCPKGRIAEDGVIDQQYPLQETPRSDYYQRTEWNVRDSDGTLIICWGPPTGGTGYTMEHAKKLGRPFFIFDLKQPQPEQQKNFAIWVAQHNIRTLNIAGPRENPAQTIYPAAKEILLLLLSR